MFFVNHNYQIKLNGYGEHEAHTRSPQQASALLKPPQKASALLKPPQKASALLKPPQKASALLKPPQKASALLKPSQKASALLKPSQKATQLIINIYTQQMVKYSTTKLFCFKQYDLMTMYYVKSGQSLADLHLFGAQ
ncbi:hypothetical protein BDF19DRAFT_413343 [Syncephalis fuscata]|nr:hypothetical protein BDF19DRAFT_413343 [Syncephalis fuscata]